jgi:ComF family protein
VFTSSIAPLIYAHPVDYLIKQIKFHDNLAAARGLGMLLAEAILNESQPQADVIIPVPLHHSRLRQRGFNQAQEIARPLSSMLGIEIDNTCCERIRPTTPQADLPLAQRHANIHGAFRVKRALSAQHVAIVDDVMTSGQTVSALGRELLKHGAEQVSIWCIARTAH